MDVAGYQRFLGCMACPVCKGIGCLDMGSAAGNDAQSSDSSLICRICDSSYPIKEGILVLTPNGGAETTYWDRLYSEGVKGNPIRSAEEISLFLSRSLKDTRSLCAYYPLVGLLERLSARFECSIEIGCGTGVYSLLLKQLRIVDNPVLVDTSISALRTAQRVFEQFQETGCFILADGSQLPFVDQSFDLSLSGGLIEHFRGAEQAKIAAEHCRVARHVICQIPAPTPFYWLQRGAITLLNGGWPFGYEKPLSVRHMRALFEDSLIEVRAISYHDSLNIVLFRLSTRLKYLKNLVRKTVLSQLMATEIVVYFDHKVVGLPSP